MSIHKLRDLVRDGLIPSRRIGGSRAPYLLCPEEVDQAIDKLAGIPNNGSIAEPAGSAPGAP